MTQWGLDTLFNPAKRHMDEEKRRLQSTREEVGDNSGGRRIDLESGKVVIRRADEDDELDEHAEPAEDRQDADAEPAQDEPANARSAKSQPASHKPAAKDKRAKDKPAKDTAPKTEAAKDKPAPSAAAQRAAARRGRTAR